jgi:hypothetical protein
MVGESLTEVYQRRTLEILKQEPYRRGMLLGVHEDKLGDLREVTAEGITSVIDSMKSHFSFYHDLMRPTEQFVVGRIEAGAMPRRYEYSNGGCVRRVR